MPAIMTHDFFGKEVYAVHTKAIGGSADERDAFLLGNQGPDPLFYLVLTMRMKPFFWLGGKMHHENPTKLILALKESLDVLEKDEVAIGRAYAAGFLCHYTLDSSMHPLVYSQQFAICDAGIAGLDRSDANEVHAEIEREFDEMVLFTKLGRTIATYKPYEEALRASDRVLSIIGKMYAYFCMVALHEFVPTDMFPAAVKNFRTVQKLFYSPKSRKQGIANAVETRVLRRNHSFFKSMAHRDNPIMKSDFDNRLCRPWVNPFTNEISSKSFWNIFDDAKTKAGENMALFLSEGFNVEDAHIITNGLDFSGEPVENMATTADGAPSEEVAYTRSLAAEDGAAQLVAQAIEEGAPSHNRASQESNGTF